MQALANLIRENTVRMIAVCVCAGIMMRNRNTLSLMQAHMHTYINGDNKNIIWVILNGSTFLESLPIVGTEFPFEATLSPNPADTVLPMNTCSYSANRVSKRPSNP